MRKYQLKITTEIVAPDTLKASDLRDVIYNHLEQQVIGVIAGRTVAEIYDLPAEPSINELEAAGVHVERS